MKNLQFIVLLLAGFAAQNGKADQTQLALDHEGVSRSYLLYLPSTYNKNIPSPLLIALHGRSSDPQRMANLTRFNTRADKHGFVVVYPEGIQQQWNYLHGISGFKPQPNDSEYLLRVVDAVTDKYSIDPDRIYLTGISNGGFMAQRLACYAPERFAGFASVAAGGYAAMPLDCENRFPVNMLYLHGTADTKVPWRGLSVKDATGDLQAVTMSITNSVKFWAERNQCSPEVTSKEILSKGNSPGTRVRILSSNNCIGNAEVILYAIVGGGHNWPGVPSFIPPSIAGRVNMDIHASDVIWSFFATKRLSR